MNDEAISVPIEFTELERQVERGNLFAHTVLTEQIMRVNEAESFIFGLIDYLIQKGVVQQDELKNNVDAVRKEIVEKKEFAALGVAIRVDDAETKNQTVAVNCQERLHICQAVCCRLRFALSVEEIETGQFKWELGKPYFNRHHEHGYCHQMDIGNKRCHIYADRPSVCRKYSCANDLRIWKNFEQMELNQEWIDTNLKQDDYRLIELFMDESGIPR